MRNLALALAWVTLLAIAWQVALILALALLLLDCSFSRDVVRTVRAAYATVRRRRAATPREAYGVDVALPGFVVAEYHEGEDGVRVIDRVEFF